ncbi:hypothetical protein PRIPAC_96885, partial [Pristionchus pacificus]|uniref:acid phosphatase n=1 Tax=Pristionchus pacificus TaxID=54126 RepID=A0A2A6D1K9_PRIPA
IIRNAESAPLQEFTSPDFAKLFRRGLGEITNASCNYDGLIRAAQLGTAFRNHYMELDLFGGSNIDNEVIFRSNRKSLKQSFLFVRSAPIRRILMSATAFSAAFTSSLIPRIRTTKNVDDEKVLIIRESIQHSCEVLARYNISDKPLCRSAAISEMENPSERLDDELEKCAGNDGRKLQFRSLSMEAGLGSAFDGQRVRAVIGPLMSIVSKNVDDAIARDVVVGTKLEPAARIYFTDDYILLSAAQALGVISEYDGRSPEFSSAIAIETWSSSEGFEIKIIMKDGLHKPFKCVASDKFLDFRKQIHSYMAMNATSVQWDEKAAKVYTLKQFLTDVGRETASSIHDEMMSKEEEKWIFEVLLIFVLVLAVARFLLCKKNKHSRITVQP